MATPFDSNNWLDRVALFLIDYGPKGWVPLLESESRRILILMLTFAMLIAVARILTLIVRTAMEGKNAFWREQFGQTQSSVENGIQKHSRTGAHRRWKRNWKFQRQYLMIRDVGHGIDEQYVKDRLPLIFQKTNLRFADAKVEKGVVYLYPDRLDQDVQLENLKKPKAHFVATPGIFADGDPIYLPVAEQNCIGGFGKPGSGKSVLAEAICKSLLWRHTNAKTYIASPKLLIDFSESLERPNTVGIDTSTIEGKTELLACLVEIQKRNERLKHEFSQLKIRHLKDHPKLSQTPEHDIVILILDEIPSYTRKRKSGDDLIQKITEAIEELILQGRAYGVIMVLLSQSAVREFSDLPLSQLHWVFSGATPTAEASRVLFGDDIGYDSTLMRGQMVLRWDGNFRIKVGR